MDKFIRNQADWQPGRNNPWFLMDFWLFSKKNRAMGRKRTDHGRGTALAESPAPAGFKIKGRLWLEKDGEAFLSWGRVVLLERIRELGSIAAAARSMDMAYSHAWSLVAEMNRLAGQELVSRSFGGKNGGRAWLTPAGEDIVAQFWRLVDTFREWIQTQKI
jgi:molybdate transport system regulatory protein